MKKLLLVAFAVLAVPIVALATPYVPSDQPSAFQGSEEWLAPRAPAPRAMLSYDPLTRYAMVAQFITTLQVADTSSADYGGMREGEHMLNVIQTDNTSESIWIWSHYYRLMGVDPYNANVAAAWDYCMSHKAYNEEGDDDPATGYYRRYNCAWALRAVMEYQDVYGDATYAAYGDSCASYLCHNPMIVNYPAGAARRLNGMIMSWAVGNLYEYGQFRSNPTFVAKAVATADTVKAWVDNNLNKFHWKEWAMEGGAVMWGIVHSTFADDPTGLEAWVAAGAPYLDTEVDPTAGAYQNAWRAWAALGQSTATEVLDSPTYGAYFEHLADTLVANDGDLDGGIPVLESDTDLQDQSWVTNYLGFMCMDRLAATAGTPSGRMIAPAFEVTASPVPSAGIPSLSFSLAKAAPVMVRVFDVGGRVVAARSEGVLEAGFHRIGLDRTGVGEPAAAGIYFYEVRAGASTARGRLVLVR
ncbi:MAG: hypothetical protein WAW06_12625 [bacterium]